MKTIILITLSTLVLPLMATAAAKAKKPAPNRPAAIVCQIQVEEGLGLPQSLTISALDTSSPESSIPDAPLMESVNEAAVAKSDLLRLGFSNECDNSYDVLLFTEDLALLKAGNVKQISAIIRGGSADIDPSTVQARSMTCVLK